MFEFLPFIKPQFNDDNGGPLSGGKLYSYIAGTSTPSGTYQDPAGVTPNTNPIILDGAGRADVYINVGGGAYKFVLTDANDVVIWTKDNVTVSAADVASGWSEHAVSDGQAATDLTGETLDSSLYSSAIYDTEILRGATLATGQVSIQFVGGTARVRAGTFMGDAHGVTFSVTQVGSVAQLRAALNAGPGAGTVKLSRRLVPA